MAQLPGGSASDFWWLHPQQPDNPLPAIQLGMQNAHQQRLDKITLAEQAYKMQVREQVSMGAAELSKVVAENFKSGDITSPESQARIWDVGTRYPTLLSTGVWKEYGDMMQNQEQIKLRKIQQQNLTAYRNQQITIAQQKADATTARAETYALSVEDRNTLGTANLKLKQLQADSTIDVNDARILREFATIDAIEQKYDLRTRELAELSRRNDLAEKKFAATLTPLEKKNLDADFNELKRRSAFGEFRDPKIKDRTEADHAEQVAIATERARINTKYERAAEPSAVMPAAPDEVPTPTTKEQYDALPPGSLYKDPQGVTKRKK